MFGRNGKLDSEWLAGVGFFNGFTEGELEEAASLGERVEMDPGATIIDQGRVGDNCYVIVEGSAAVYIGGDFVTSVGSGAMVGEMALVEHRPRNASVLAETDMVLVAFGTKQFKRLIERSPNTHERVMAMLNSRLQANEERKG